MAVRSYILCEPLYYIFNKYGRDYENEIKSVLYDFYLSVDIGIAKEMLSNELQKLNPTRWTKPVRRRDGSIEKQDTRVKKEIADILSMMDIIHDQKLVDKLPIFVCADIKRVPSSRFEAGDFQSNDSTS